MMRPLITLLTLAEFMSATRLLAWAPSPNKAARIGEGQWRSAKAVVTTATQRDNPRLKKLNGAKIMKNERETPVPSCREKKVTMTMMQLASSAPSAALIPQVQSLILPSTR